MTGRLIEADELKKLMIETLEHIKENPKMNGQEMHIIAAIHMLSEMIDDAPTIEAIPVKWARNWIYKNMTYGIPERMLIEWQKEQRKEE